MKKLISIAAAAALLAFAGSAFAAATSTNLTVSASVAAACTASTTTQINFGALDPINGAAITNAAGAILVNCTQGTGYTLTAPATETIANTHTGELISYTPSTPAVPANDGAVAGKPYVISASVAKTAYANAPAGAYSGTLTVTVNY